MDKNNKSIYVIIRAIVFLAICIFGFMTIGRGFVPIDSSKLSPMKCGQYYQLEKDSLDVLAVGASTVKGGFASDYLYEQTGIVAYNRGTSAMPPSLFYYSVKEALKTQHPQVVILDAGQLYKTYEYNKDENVCMTLFANMDFCKLSKDKLDAAVLVSQIANKHKVIDNLFPMFHYHNNWKTVSYGDFSDAVRVPEDKLMGQWPIFDIRPMDTLLGHMDEKRDDDRTFDEEGLKSFNKTIDLCKKNGIKVLLFRSPRDDWNMEDYQVIKDYADEMGVDYLDMNFDEIIKMLDFDYSQDFENTHHLSYSGAEKMTRYLGDYLINNYDIDTSDTSDSVRKWMDSNVKYYHQFIKEQPKNYK